MLEATSLTTAILGMRHQTETSNKYKEQLTSYRDLPVFPKSGSGGGPGMPSFLNTDNVATQYLGKKE